MKIYVPLLKKDPPPDPGPRVSNPVFLGVRTEAGRDDSAGESFVTFVVGIGPSQGTHKLSHAEGYPLRYYLARLKLINLAAHAAIYDMTNLEHGRCRMSYVPAAGATIRLGPSKMGSASHFQRSNYNPEDLARRMGGGSKIVERSK